MSDPQVEPLIRRLHEQHVHVALVATGGGSGAIAELLEVPGGSRTLLEGVVPYSAAALAQYLRGAPEQFCDEHTARRMAMQAFQRARKLSAATPCASEIPPFAPIGIACTASLASEPAKKGPHRAHVAWQTAATTATAALQLQKGARTRCEEEQLVCRLILNQLADACGLPDRLTLDLRESEQVFLRRTDAPQAWQNLMFGQTAAVRSGSAPQAAEGGRAIFPGAFHPLHIGHLRMAEVAERILNCETEFEISITNVDKPPLDYLEMAQRAAQFVPPGGAPGPPMWFTRAATFAEKAELFPGATFVVGADTIARIADVQYYGGDSDRMQQAVAEIAARDCRFLVFGRSLAGRFESLADLQLPSDLRRLCQEVPADTFREDISSTALRQRQQQSQE